MARDWHEWHRAYDDPHSPLSRRLALVQGVIRDVLDAAPPGPVRIVSMCAGQGRDLLGALDSHPRRADVHARLVELDPELCAAAREAAPPLVDVVCGDAGLTDMYEGAVPADVVMACGVFGNIPDADIKATLAILKSFCAPNATLIWTRHRQPPDATVWIREHLASLGFEELTYLAPDDTMFGIGAARLTVDAAPFRPHVRMFSFFEDGLPDACPVCSFSYALRRPAITGLLRSDARRFVSVFDELPAERVRAKAAPGVWSPLEYACHVRDVLRVQLDRVEQALREHEPTFVPMRRDERAIEDRYNEQDPATVAGELTDSAEALAARLDALDDDGWSRQGVYNYPEPQLRTVEWIAIHTVHELLHHRIDIGTLA